LYSHFTPIFEYKKRKKKKGINKKVRGKMGIKINVGFLKKPTF
jgi:hypothetical protein